MGSNEVYHQLNNAITPMQGYLDLMELKDFDVKFLKNNFKLINMGVKGIKKKTLGLDSFRRIVISIFNLASEYSIQSRLLDKFKDSCEKCIERTFTSSINYSDINLENLINKNVSKRKKDSVKYHFDKYTNDSSITSDQNCLSAVFHTLISNAYNAIEDSDNEGNIHIELKKNEDYVQISFYNDGIPMADDENIGRIRFNTNKYFNNDKKGCIGLYTSKKIIEKIGGEFYWTPLKKGTKFYINLPNEKHLPVFQAHSS